MRVFFVAVSLLLAILFAWDFMQPQPQFHVACFEFYLGTVCEIRSEDGSPASQMFGVGAHAQLAEIAADWNANGRPDGGEIILAE